MVVFTQLAGAAAIIASLSGFSFVLALPAEVVGVSIGADSTADGVYAGGVSATVAAVDGPAATTSPETDAFTDVVTVKDEHTFFPHVNFDPTDPRFNISNSDSEMFGKRDVAGVYECAGHYWKGPCTWTRADGGRCHNRIYGSTGSIGPDRGIVCRVYERRDCFDDGWISIDGFRFPGFGNQQASDWLFKHSMSANGIVSYKCRWG